MLRLLALTHLLLVLLCWMLIIRHVSVAGNSVCLMVGRLCRMLIIQHVAAACTCVSIGWTSGREAEYAAGAYPSWSF